MRITAVTSLIALSVLLAACGGSHKDPDITSARLIYSPNGEPLSGGPLGHPSCEEALARWFDRLDTDRRGAIDLDRYLADARRQFAAMDLDKQGAVTADVLTRYRAPYNSDARPETAASATESSKSAPRSGEGAHRQGQSGTGPRAAGSSNDRGHSADEEPDPVMAADLQLQFKVTLSDFIAYEQHRFAELNAKHDGRLAKAEVLALCPGNRGR